MTPSLDELKAAADRAEEAFLQANDRYRQAIKAEIARLEGAPVIEPPRTAPAPPAHPVKSWKRKKAAPDRRLSPRQECGSCGTGGLKRATGRAGGKGLLQSHRAPCGLFCVGGGTKKLRGADASSGFHGDACPRCKPSTARRHGIPGNPGVLTGAPKATGFPCGTCGRGGFEKPVGIQRFHRAPICELPCRGGDISKCAKEDLAEGLHTGKDCRGCQVKKRASA